MTDAKEQLMEVATEVRDTANAIEEDSNTTAIVAQRPERPGRVSVAGSNPAGGSVHVAPLTL